MAKVDGSWVELVVVEEGDGSCWKMADSFVEEWR